MSTTKIKTRRISLTSEKGFKDAERLQARGWIVTGNGWDTVTLSNKQLIQQESK